MKPVLLYLFDWIFLQFSITEGKKIQSCGKLK